VLGVLRMLPKTRVAPRQISLREMPMMRTLSRPSLTPTPVILPLT
jgi:hypothetical protein